MPILTKPVVVKTIALQLNHPGSFAIPRADPYILHRRELELQLWENAIERLELLSQFMVEISIRPFGPKFSPEAHQYSVGPIAQSPELHTENDFAHWGVPE